MKPIPIEIQEKLVKIPAINVIIIFIWLYNSFFIKTLAKYVAHSFIILLLSAIPLVSLQIFVSYYFPSIYEVVYVMNAYLIPFSVGNGLIVLQKKAGKNP